MKLIDHALAWAARGFRVFPVQPGSKVPPKGTFWRAEATSDPAKIRAWWAFNPNYNYGVAGGDGWLIVDVDAGKNGFASLLDVDLPETLTVRTPGGGLHMYYRGPDVATSVDRVAPGIDIRSKGGYVVGPGSVFDDADGAKGYRGAYTLIDDRPIADAPAGFILQCGEPKQRDRAQAVSVDDPDDIVFAIHYLEKDAPPAVEGRGGNLTTFKVAARVMEIGTAPETALALMMEHWNSRCSPPWDIDELKAVVKNAETYMKSTVGSGGVSVLKDQGGAPVELPAPSAHGKYSAAFAKRKLIPLNQIAPRDWLMHRMLLRRKASILAGGGGAGKSSLSLVLAAHGAVGRSFGNYHVPRPFKTVVYNLEDDLEEMNLRMHATCAIYGLDEEEVERNVLMWSGEDDTPFTIMDKNRNVLSANVGELVREINRIQFDAIILDPLASLHGVDENDNVAMGEVMRTLNSLAKTANVASLIIHHTPKGVRAAGSQDAVRGAGNIVNAVRIAATMYAADEHDAALYGFGEGYRDKYVRLDDAKINNSAKSGKPLWLERQNFPLPNGDSSYALRPFDTTATSAGEGRMMATILAAYMDRHGTQHLLTHDAAKVLTDAEPYFREQVPASGDLRHLKVLVELRLATPVEVDGGLRVSVQTKTVPGGDTARRYVVIEA
jgi:hypothetical protein